MNSVSKNPLAFLRLVTAAEHLAIAGQQLQPQAALVAQISEPHHSHTGIGQIKIRRRITHSGIESHDTIR